MQIVVPYIVILKKGGQSKELAIQQRVNLILHIVYILRYTKYAVEARQLACMRVVHAHASSILDPFQLITITSKREPSCQVPTAKVVTWGGKKEIRP